MSRPDPTVITVTRRRALWFAIQCSSIALITFALGIAIGIGISGWY